LHILIFVYYEQKKKSTTIVITIIIIIHNVGHIEFIAEMPKYATINV